MTEPQHTHTSTNEGKKGSFFFLMPYGVIICAEKHEFIFTNDSDIKSKIVIYLGLNENLSSVKNSHSLKYFTKYFTRSVCNLRLFA